MPKLCEASSGTNFELGLQNIGFLADPEQSNANRCFFSDYFNLLRNSDNFVIGSMRQQFRPCFFHFTGGVRFFCGFFLKSAYRQRYGMQYANIGWDSSISGR